MYNLIIGATNGNIGSDRVLEYTEDAIKARFSDANGPLTAQLVELPTLLMPELQNLGEEPAEARVGRLSRFQRLGRDYKFVFTPHASVPPIPLDRVPELADQLGLDSAWELNRTHLAVKDRDLFEVAISVSAPNLEPTVFSFPTGQARERDLVAVMMPFAGFDQVYDAIRGAVQDAGLRCLRADDIWEREHIMDDVISLIWRAELIVCDWTDRNPNVFYETGIAHSLGRTVVPITQNMNDVPFDLRSLRALRYLNNGEGRAKLRGELTTKLETYL